MECIFQKAGFILERQESSHRSYTREGRLRPVVIPTYNEIDVDIIHGLMRTAGMKRTEYFKYLEQCK